MAITIADNVTNLDTYIGDSSTDRFSSAQRLQFITEATVWLKEQMGSEMETKTYVLSYFDTLHDYKVTSAIADLLEGADLRREESDQLQTFSKKSSKELAEEIGQRATESSYAIERRDSNSYLIINHSSKYGYRQISTLESTTADGGTWAVDSSSSDATNLTIDSIEFKQGAGCFNFDVDVSQSGNNRATISNSTLNEMDLSDFENLGSWLFWVYIPENAEFSSITLYWGSDTSNYWSATVTTAANGSSWADGWNRVRVGWADATATSSPDSDEIDYIRFDLNYTGSQLDDTDFRLDDLKLARPEKLTFFYESWHVGTNSSGTSLGAFTATTDVPFYSGQYDSLKYAVAHKAASLAFSSLRLPNKAQEEEVEALQALRRQRILFPANRTPEVKSFKPLGISFTRRK